MTTVSQPTATDGELALARSQRLRAEEERRRLERILLMLPAALRDFSPLRAAELFADAVSDVTASHTVLVVLPQLLAHPVSIGAEPWPTRTAAEMAKSASLAPAFDGNVVYIGDVARLAAGIGGISDPLLSRHECGSVAAVPIRGHGERPHGVLCFTHRRRRAFSERQLALAAALAAQLGQLLELTEAVAEQTRISTALQESLLPPVLPLIPRLDLAVIYQPSGYGNLVGGDFYDVFRLSGSGCDILVGDASGVGPEAAGLAGIARYTARALAESGYPPGAILGRLNPAILRASTEGRFCSATLARVSIGADRLTIDLASAGHPPALVIRPDGQVAPAISETGTILGVTAAARVGQASLSLSPGDALLLYTDGVIEARDGSGELFGDERLFANLAVAAGRSAEGIARRLELAVRDHRGGGEGDDVAIVVLKLRLPPESGGQPTEVD